MRIFVHSYILRSFFHTSVNVIYRNKYNLQNLNSFQQIYNMETAVSNIGLFPLLPFDMFH